MQAYQPALDHLRMMEAVQPSIDAAIPKTVNVPADYPYADFKDRYTEAWRAGLKGLATYRPNSVTGSVLSVDGMHGGRPVTIERPFAFFMPANQVAVDRLDLALKARASATAVHAGYALKERDGGCCGACGGAQAGA